MGRGRAGLSGERRLVVWLALLAGLCLALYLLRAALMPFVAGMAVAYLLDPLADRLERLGLPRGAAAGLIVAGFVVAFFALLIIFIPILSAQFTDFIGRLPGYAETIEKATAPYLAELKAKLARGQAQRLQSLLEQYASDAMGSAGAVVSQVVSGGAAVLNLLGLAVVTPVVAFYLLRDWDRLVAHLDQVLPRRSAAGIRDIMREIDRRLSGFVRGQVLVCLMLGSWYATGLVLIGLDFGLLLGMIAGLISVIPYLGNVVGLGIGLAIAFTQFDGWREPLLVAAVFGSGQILEGYVLQPRIIGDRVGLHPVWLMFAVIAGGTLLGLTGALLAVPAAAVIGVLVRFSVTRYLASGLYSAHPEEEPPVRPGDDGGAPPAARP